MSFLKPILTFKNNFLAHPTEITHMTAGNAPSDRKMTRDH